MIVGNIKSLRVDRDFKQKEIADMLFISRSTYSAYENGANATPLEVLVKLSDIYNTSVDYLLGLTDKQEPYPRKNKGAGIS